MDDVWYENIFDVLLSSCCTFLLNVCCVFIFYFQNCMQFKLNSDQKEFIANVYLCLSQTTDVKTESDIRKKPCLNICDINLFVQLTIK